MNARRLAPLALAAVLGLASPAHAAFHLIKVVEVFAGTAASPNAQYVVLQMFFGGQTFVSGHNVIVRDATGAEVGRATFVANVANGASQARILVATAEAAALFGVAPDLTMPAVIPRAGGSVCFDAIDCVAFGAYTGPTTGVGTPAVRSGIPRGEALVRRLDIAAGATTLEDADDTNDSRNDFTLGAPTPRNNAGLVGATPSSTCGNGTTEGLEACDDGGVMPGDGCDASCRVERCGDGRLATGETCDDENGVSGDGCDANCTPTACGNGVVTLGELCDDANATSGDGCDANCTPTACGNGVVTSGELCDDSNPTSGDGCDVNCTPTGCGNGVVTAGEDCEPPSVGACDATCQMGCSTDADCADSDPCTTDERCVTAACTNEPTPSDDGEECTADGCDATGVFHDPLADGTACGASSLREICLVGACGPSRCGDAFVDGPALGGDEICDDGNDVTTDDCVACSPAFCGDGFVLDGVEACDDGNDVDADDCVSCALAFCGDGVVRDDVETCDDGDLNGTAGHCPADCGDPRPIDAGVADGGGVVRRDGGGTDGGAALDAGATPPAPASSGCSCRAGRRGSSGLVLLLGIVGALAARRRRQPEPVRS